MDSYTHACACDYHLDGGCLCRASVKGGQLKLGKCEYANHPPETRKRLMSSCLEKETHDAILSDRKK